MKGTERPPFDIRDHLEKLASAKEKNRYICPVCQGNNLTIEPETGEYQCWNGCECRDIREAVSPWEQVVRGATSYQPIGSRKPIIKNKPKAFLPAAIPEEAISLARLPLPVVHPERRQRGENKIEIEYPYSDSQWVLRIETRNPENSKGYDKVTIPYHLNAEGKIVKSKGEAPWHPYRMDEVQAYGSGKWVLGVEGETCVEAARGLGLVSFTFQGGGWTKADLDSAIAQHKTAGVAGICYFPDHDETGYKKAADLAEAAAKNGMPFIRLDPTLLWSECPAKGDIADWLKWGMDSQGWDREEFIRKLEAQFDAMAQQERLQQNQNIKDEEDELDSDQNLWLSPESWRGEIGWLIPGAEELKFHPKCNFDFHVERELESEEGGGVVLQVKRSLDSVEMEKRVIINSVDYGSVKTFEKALKQALGAGIVINLKDEQLKALIHVRLREYRDRGGKLYKLIDRYGQQPDGVWVHRDRQYTKNGELTNEEESGWVFNPALGKEDFIPCPELAPEDPEALKKLIDACCDFFGEKNIHQVLLTMGWVVAGIHSQAIFEHDNCFPLLNPNGDPGTFKTLAAEAGLSLVGKNWAQMGMLARVSLSALYEHGSRTAGLPFMLDDPERSNETDEIFKTWYNWKPRRVRGNDQQPKSPLGAITNHVVGGEQAATFTRFVRLTYERASGGNKQAFQELRKAQASASGAFPLILKMGYDPEAIAAIERELLPHLPLAHARIAQSLAIPLYYAQKLIEETGHSSSYNLKQWVIEHCCASENDSDNAADSLQDFIDKIVTLQAESSVGAWNFIKGISRGGKLYAAIFATNVWALVDKRFSPATYNFKSLKPLVVKAGGVIDATVRFERDRDSFLHLERVRSSTPEDAHGSLNPPDTIPRKAWLIPLDVFDGNNPLRGNNPTGNNNPIGGNNPLSANNPVGGNNPVVTENVTGVTGCNRTPVTSSSDEFSRVSASSEVPCNCVTEKIEIDREREGATQAESIAEFPCEASENLGYTSYTVTEQPVTTIEQGLQAVTESPSLSVTKPVTRLQGISESQGGDAVSESPQGLNNPCDNSRFLEGVPGEFKRGDSVLTPQGKGEVLYFDDYFKEYIVRLPDSIPYFKPSELSLLPLVEEFPKAPSAVPSEESSSRPSKKSPKVAVPSEKILAALRGRIAAAASTTAQPTPAPAQELAQETTAQPTPAPVAPIKIGSRVRYLGKGSARHGMVGRVIDLTDNGVKILLNYHPSLAGHLRDLKAALSHLELLE